jgi:Ni/Co efflux regulator RcnB
MGGEMNKFTSVLAAIALAATSNASSAVEETTDKRNAHRAQALKQHTVDKAKTPAKEAKTRSAQRGTKKPE